jgi:hypothetical protein
VIALKSKHRKLKIIGWREWIGLPDFAIPHLKVKVDSGARTSALHATKIRYLKEADGLTWVSFVITENMSPQRTKRVRAPLVEKRRVKSSMGHASIRPVVRTTIQLGDETWSTEITLVNRDPMGFRMLLGRTALKGRYMIHPARSFVQSADLSPLSEARGPL